ncbi:MAG TPA: hypothetical protein VI953_01710 [Candidatus Paceibacterota bacterium]
MPPEGSQNLIDRMKERLYRRGAFKADVSRSKFSQARDDVPTAFTPSEDTSGSGMLTPKLLKKLLIFATAFFVMAVMAAIYIVWSGSNVVSSSNLDIALKGPVSIKAGEELSLGVIISNNNSINLEGADLLVTFPPGTRTPGNLEQEQQHYRKDLGVITQGQVRNERIKAVLFGPAGSTQDIKIVLEYRTAGSNAIFEKTVTYKANISSAPLDIVLVMPDEVTAGGQIDLSFDLSTGSAEGLSGVLLQLTYPSGFKFVSATPKPVAGNNVWGIGTLSSHAPRHISVSGILDGQDGEEKLFKALAGSASAQSESKVGVPYASALHTVSMRKSFVGLSSTLNGEAGAELVANPATTIRGDITWVNNLPDKIQDAQVHVSFAGSAFDQASVVPGNGAYASINNTIEWKQQHEQSLGIIDAGGTSHVNFDFNTLPVSALTNSDAKNPYVDLTITFDGTRVINGAPGSSVHARVTKRVKVNSKLDLVTRAVYSSGPFLNTGPLPPKANVETTYTVLWSAVNTSNEVDNLTVTAVLPSHSRFANNISPAAANLKYDPTRGTITWNIGRLPAGNLGAPGAEVAFQIALLPSVTQVGQTLPLVTNMAAQGTDLFTGTTLQDSVNLIDMRVSTDPNFQEEWARVSQ